MVQKVETQEDAISLRILSAPPLFSSLVIGKRMYIYHSHENNSWHYQIRANLREFALLIPIRSEDRDHLTLNSTPIRSTGNPSIHLRSNSSHRSWAISTEDTVNQSEKTGDIAAHTINHSYQCLPSVFRTISSLEVRRLRRRNTTLAKVHIGTLF